jgi:hypothetical protein
VLTRRRRRHDKIASLRLLARLSAKKKTMPNAQIVDQHQVAKGLQQVTNLEPCASTFGDIVFCTGGELIHTSIDRGASFPNARATAGTLLFPGSKSIDQSAMWVPQISRLIWAMGTDSASSFVCAWRVRHASRTRSISGYTLRLPPPILTYPACSLPRHSSPLEPTFSMLW